MRVLEKTRREIEEKFVKMGDYVKIDYLSSCLKNNIDYDTRKFVLVRLSGLYENKKMFLEAGKMMKYAAEINTTYKGKIEDFMKASELFVKGGFFDEADGALKGAIANATENQKADLNAKIKEVYKEELKFCLKNDKRIHSVRICQKLLSLNLGESERKESMETLLSLYDKLGKVREYYMLKKQIK